MKKLLLFLIFTPSFLHALDPRESVTSGSLGLLIPSTGYLDVNRRLDDKYNKNYQMIASTINTHESRLNTIATDTTTVLSVVKSTAVQLSNHITSINLSTNTINTRLLNGALSIYNEGTAIGNATTINCVGSNIDCTQSGSTTTVTISGGGAAVSNSTFAATITVGGEIVFSSATPPFFPGAWWAASADSCTITSVQAVVQNPSLASAVFPFYAVQQSSWQWSQYGSLVVSTGNQRSIVKSEAILVTSSNSFIVGVASTAVSNPAANLGLWFQYWCNP